MVVERAALLREGLRRIVESDDSLTLAKACDPDDAIEWLQAPRPDVIVVGPSDASLAFLRRLRDAAPDAGLVVIVDRLHPLWVREVLAIGTDACVGWASSARILFEAIRDAAAGERYLDPLLGAALLRSRTGLSQLTARQLDVLRLVALGYSSGEIALALNLSVRTVEGHRARAQERLELERRSDVVRFAAEQGLISSSWPA
jgi:two-component system response regulator NreC